MNEPTYTPAEVAAFRLSQTSRQLETAMEEGCDGHYDHEGDFECGYGATIDCEDCRFGSCGGRKDPRIPRNQK